MRVHCISAAMDCGLTINPDGAIANALFALTGKRVRRLPITPERVKG